MGGGPISPASKDLSNEPLTLRQATKDDLDNITWIIVNAYPDDPGCDYRFPYRDEYPSDFWKWTRVEYEEYLNQSDKFVNMVVTAPVLDHGEVVHQPISIGVWDLAVRTDFTGGDHGINERRDANPQHMSEFTTSCSDGFKKHFRRYGYQMPLWSLATHPDFRRRGAATMICQWGQKEGLKRNQPQSLLASPMGKPLYLSLGYKVVGTVVVQVDGEEEKLEMDAMINLNE
ncbi:hypothetical protein NW762_001568 [Fusarium torreyae]|uniref:N-acetyltransferase domain-containing protein n=1 Tax=Fusarium torreyae TaxID=1237075 RepID=A0A9W8VP23_9HYPO|nr:hypothetical protein NW762_001568 [Fusarium torreyae]